MQPRGRVGRKEVGQNQLMLRPQTSASSLTVSPQSLTVAAALQHGGRGVSNPALSMLALDDLQHHVSVRVGGQSSHVSRLHC